MNKTLVVLAATALSLGLAAPSFAQSAGEKIIGTIIGLSGSELDLTAADGSKVAVTLDPKTRIALSKPITIDDIKVGSYVGAGAQADGKGGNTAVEITVFPESARGLGDGFRKWDQGPNSTMTNGTVSQVLGTSNRTLTVTYKGGQQAVTIPDGTPIVTFANGDNSALVAGAHVVVRGSKGSDGAIDAAFVSVGADGSIPPG